jgi:hypothetical protein
MRVETGPETEARRAWLQGLVDRRNFPGVHWSFTREEALELPSQAFMPQDGSDSEDYY